MWHDVTEAVKRRDQEVATDAKAKIEDRQREETAKRNNDGIDWHPQLFKRVEGGDEEDLDWIINTKVLVHQDRVSAVLLTLKSDGRTSEENVKQILQIHAILPGQKPDRQFSIPSRTDSFKLTQAHTSQPTEPVQPVESSQTTLPIRSAQNESAPNAQPQPQPQLSQQPLQQSIDPNPISTSTHAPLSRTTEVNASTNPPVYPFQKPEAQPADLAPELKEKIARELPPSKLLHSNPAPEPKNPHLLERKDSNTNEVDEFHDAQS